MSRIRSIKPEFWSDEKVVECSTNARLLFIGLWNFCDDCGRHSLSPKQIKALVFPADDFTLEDVRRMLDELSSNGLIELYEVETKQYFYIVGWKHQRIDRPQAPRFPEPPPKVSPNVRRTLATEGIRDGKGIDQDNSGLRPDAKASPESLDEDAKKVLFSAGLEWLGKETGKADRALRPMLGKMLADVGGDAHAGVLLGIFRDAKRERKADPVSWIQAMILSRGARAGPQRETGGSALLEIIKGGFSDGLERNGFFDDTNQGHATGAAKRISG